MSRSRSRTCFGLGNGCSGEMWSPLDDNPPRSVAPAPTSSGHQSARLGGIWMPTSGISRRVSCTSRRMSSIETGHAHDGRSRCGASLIPVAQKRSAASVAMSAGSSP